MLWLIKGKHWKEILIGEYSNSRDITHVKIPFYTLLRKFNNFFMMVYVICDPQTRYNIKMTLSALAIFH